MLRIKANKHYLNLPENIKINLIIENPFMLNDRIPSPYSLTFELEATPHNTEVLGHPNRINASTGFGEHTCEILFGPVTILSGVLVVASFNKTISANFIGKSFDDLIKLKLSEVDMERHDFGSGNIMFTQFDTVGHYSYNYKALIAAGLTPAAKNFVSAPVRIASESLDGLDAQGGWRMGNLTYLNMFNARNNNYMFGSRHANVLPMPYVHYIIDTIFADILEANPFSSGDLAKLVMVTTFHKSYPQNILLDTTFPPVLPQYTSGGSPKRPVEADISEAEKADAYLKLNSFLTDMTANDFLKGVLKVFCATLYPIKNKYKIVQNKDILNSTAVESWSGKLTDILSFAPAEKVTYEYGYSENDKQSEKTASSELAKISDLIAETTLSTDEEGAYFKITSTGQVFRKIIVDGEATYELISSGLGGNQVDGNAYSMKSDVMPLPMNIHKYWWDYRGDGSGLDKLDWYVPEWNGTRTQRQTNAYIMFYHGTKATFTPGDQYPFLTDHNYDHQGNRLGDTSLHWEGPDGLLEKYHSEFKAWIEKEKKTASGVFLLTPLDIKNLDLEKKKNINGKNFFVEKMSLTITLNSIEPTVVDFIEA